MKICVIDYNKDQMAWTKGKLVYEHMRNIQQKNPNMFRSMLKNLNDMKWFELAEKNKGNWPHPHDFVTKVMTLIEFESPDDFLWIPELNLFFFRIRDEKEEQLVLENFPEVEIYSGGKKK